MLISTFLYKAAAKCGAVPTGCFAGMYVSVKTLISLIICTFFSIHSDIAGISIINVSVSEASIDVVGKTSIFLSQQFRFVCGSSPKDVGFWAVPPLI